MKMHCFFVPKQKQHHPYPYIKAGVFVELPKKKKPLFTTLNPPPGYGLSGGGSEKQISGGWHTYIRLARPLGDELGAFDNLLPR